MEQPTFADARRAALDHLAAARELLAMECESELTTGGGCGAEFRDGVDYTGPGRARSLT